MVLFDNSIVQTREFLKLMYRSNLIAEIFSIEVNMLVAVSLINLICSSPNLSEETVVDGL